MSNLFLAKYYPVRRTAKVRAQITAFKQGIRDYPKGLQLLASV
jgi:hypothetical protein